MGLILTNFIIMGLNSADLESPRCRAAASWRKQFGDQVVTHPRTTAVTAAVATGVVTGCIAKRTTADDRSVLVIGLAMGIAAVAGVATWATCDHYARKKYQAETDALRVTNDRAHAEVTARIAAVAARAAVLDSQLGEFNSKLLGLNTRSADIIRSQKAGQLFLDQLGFSVAVARTQNQALRAEINRAQLRSDVQIGGLRAEVASFGKKRALTVSEIILGGRHDFNFDLLKHGTLVAGGTNRSAEA